MWIRFIVFLGFLSLIQSSQLNSNTRKSAKTESLVGGSQNKNLFEYLHFLSEVMAIDDPDTYQTIKAHAETDLLTVTAHNTILERLLPIYSKQLNTFPPKEKFVEESFAAYLKYVLKRNFDKSPNFVLSSEHRLKVITTFTNNFAQIALDLIQLKKPAFIEILFKEMTKDLEPRSKILVLKEVIRICNHRTVSSRNFLLMLQSFIKTCPETFLAVEMISNLHTTQICSNWEKEVFMAPIQFALTNVNSQFELSKTLLTRFLGQKHYFNQEDLVSILNRILHLTKFLSRNQISSLEEVGKRREIVDLIVSAFFPHKSLYEILTDCAQFDEILVFEAVLLYDNGQYSITEGEYAAVLDYVILCSALRLSDILTTSTLSGIRIEELLISFDMEILISIVAFTPHIEHKILDNVEAMPGTIPLALNVVLEIVQQLITIINSFPQLSLTLQVPEGESEIVYLSNFPELDNFDTVVADIIDRFPVHIFAARIFLFKVFAIPLAATRFLDSSNESATWSEAVAFINFYIERFSQISAIEKFYKVVMI